MIFKSKRVFRKNLFCASSLGFRRPYSICRIDNWLRVMIELGEDTTSDDLRSAIPLALL
jgi:hypothetical protein